MVKRATDTWGGQGAERRGLGSRRARTIAALLAAVMPRALRTFVWRRLLGYQIDPTAAIGHALIDVDVFRAGPGAQVGSLTLIRGCERVELEAQAIIAPLVWVNAVRTTNSTFMQGKVRETALVMRYGAAITSLHFLDCCDRIEIGEFAIVAGMQSQLLTHSLDVTAGEMYVAPIVIGAYSMIGTRTVVLPGAVVGAKCVVGAGSVLLAGSYEPLSLHAGVPAVRKSGLSPDAGIFVRQDVLVR